MLPLFFWPKKEILAAETSRPFVKAITRFSLPEVNLGNVLNKNQGLGPECKYCVKFVLLKETHSNICYCVLVGVIILPVLPCICHNVYRDHTYLVNDEWGIEEIIKKGISPFSAHQEAYHFLELLSTYLRQILANNIIIRVPRWQVPWC
jgi:hypothetical protein